MAMPSAFSGLEYPKEAGKGSGFRGVVRATVPSLEPYLRSKDVVGRVVTDQRDSTACCGLV